MSSPACYPSPITPHAARSHKPFPRASAFLSEPPHACRKVLTAPPHIRLRRQRQAARRLRQLGAVGSNPSARAIKPRPASSRALRTMTNVCRLVFAGHSFGSSRAASSVIARRASTGSASTPPSAGPGAALSNGGRRPNAGNPAERSSELSARSSWHCSSFSPTARALPPARREPRRGVRPIRVSAPAARCSRLVPALRRSRCGIGRHQLTQDRRLRAEHRGHQPERPDPCHRPDQRCFAGTPEASGGNKGDVRGPLPECTASANRVERRAASGREHRGLHSPRSGRVLTTIEYSGHHPQSMPAPGRLALPRRPESPNAGSFGIRGAVGG